MAEAIIAAVGGIFSGITGLISGSREAKYSRLPDWLSPKDFQREDKTLDYLMIGMAIVMIVLIGSIAFVMIKKGK